MKIKELVSALETLGKAYTNSRKKDEPAPCILQVLKLLKGSEDLDIENLLRKVAEKKAAPAKGKKARPFDLDEHLKVLTAAQSDGEFLAALTILKKANPTVANLKSLISAYTGVTRKSGKKEELWRALEAGYNAARRDERRERIASGTLPI